jgi:hypothetical protein
MGTHRIGTKNEVITLLKHEHLVLKPLKLLCWKNLEVWRSGHSKTRRLKAECLRSSETEMYVV